jgi:hypothetical protein
MARGVDAALSAITYAVILVAQVSAAKFWSRGRCGSASILVGSYLGALESGHESWELLGVWSRLLLRRPDYPWP